MPEMRLEMDMTARCGGTYRRRARTQVQEPLLEAPKKVPAYRAVERALKTGKLARPPYCQGCLRDLELYAHHYLGYDKKHWLDVHFLCIQCHGRAHREINARKPVLEQAEEG